MLTRTLLPVLLLIGAIATYSMYIKPELAEVRAVDIDKSVGTVSRYRSVEIEDIILFVDQWQDDIELPCGPRRLLYHATGIEGSNENQCRYYFM